EHGARVADPVGDDARCGAHGPHAVGDDPRQAHRGGDAIVPVDRVEVAAGAGVPDQAGAVDGDLAAGDLVADGQAHESSGRTARVETTVVTGSPSSDAISARVVIMASPARTVIEST